MNFTTYIDFKDHHPSFHVHEGSKEQPVKACLKLLEDRIFGKMAKVKTGDIVVLSRHPGFSFRVKGVEKEYYYADMKIVSYHLVRL